MQQDAWTERELQSVDFGDLRINRRYLQIAELFDLKPEASIPNKCDEWSITKAAYRFFDNKKVTPLKMIEPHIEETVRRVERKSIVLAIQDTSFFNYNSRSKAKGLGRISIGAAYGNHYTNQGLIMHTTYAVDIAGLPLGVLDQDIFVRNKEESEVVNNMPTRIRKGIPIELKESKRWIEPFERFESFLTPEVRNKLVHVCDREGDFYDLFWAAQRHGAQVLVRASFDRVVDKYVRKKGYVNEKIFARAKKQPVVGNLEVEVGSTTKRAARTAVVSISVGNFNLQPNRFHPAIKAQPEIVLPLSYIYVIEKNPPENQEPLEWLLFTNLTVTDYDSALEKVKWYQRRFTIETFHKILKSGFNAEECQLSSGDKLKKYLTMISILAWRIHWMTHIARVEPNAPAEQILRPLEIKILQTKYMKKKTRDNKKLIPEWKPATTYEALRWVAQLGGFLARKGDGEPGPKAIWNGWTRLADIVLGYELMLA
jgi:hypothetical protein